MNILIINGSPRKRGLVSQMLDIMREEAEKRGNTVEMVYTNDLTVKPCTGCMACRTKEKCVLAEDNLAHLFPVPPCADGRRTCRPILRRTAKDNKYYMNMRYREEAIECVKDHVLQIHKQIYAKYEGNFDKIYTEGYNSKSYTGRVIEPGKIYELSYLECTCPKVKYGQRNHPQQCECSRQSILYILSQLEPDSQFDVRIENTILRGSDRCTFRITKHKGIYLRRK